MTSTATAPLTLGRVAELLAGYTDADGRSRGGRGARLAQRLVGVPEEAWGPAVTHAVWRAAQDARFTLLTDHDADVDALPEPPAAEGKVQVRAVFERDGHDGVLLVFSYDQAIWQAVKALPDRHYDPEAKEWTLPATRFTAEALVGLLNTHRGFTVAPATGARLRALLAGEAISTATCRAEPVGERGWRLYLPKPTKPRDYALLARVRKLSNARFFSATGRAAAHWWVDTTQPGGLDALAALLAAHPEIELSDDARRALPGATLTVATVATAAPATEAEPASAAPAIETCGDVKANAKTFSINAGGDGAVKAKAGRLLGAKYDSDSKRWRVPRHELAAPGLAALIAEHPRLAVTTETREALDRLAAAERLRIAHADKVAYFSGAKEIPAEAVDSVLEGFGKTLHPFQRIPVIYPRLGVRRFWVADSMGLGKTVEAEAVLYAERAWPAVITCPPSHRGNWRRELLEAIPDCAVAVVRGKTPDPDAIADADFVVIQHDLIVHWLDALRARQFVGFVADESHAFVNAGSKSNKGGEVKGTKRTWAVGELAADVRARNGLVLLLTGTPIKNGKNAELIPQLEILGELERIGAALADPPGRVGVAAKQKFLWHFCLPADAPVLMADMTERPISKVVTGDTVIGWAPNEETVGRHRRLVESRVLHIHRREGQPLQRVTLSDGSHLVCTPDHRWFTGAPESAGFDAMYQPARVGRDGGSGPGAATKIVKITGRLRSPYVDDADYGLGYLHGLFRGDGFASRVTKHTEHLFRGTSTTGIDAHRVGVGCNDSEPIDRAERLLHEHGVAFTRRHDGPMHRLDLHHADGFAFFATEQPDTDAWWAGFLAGIYDAEGSGSRIYQYEDVNPRTSAMIANGLERLGIPFRRGANRQHFSIKGGRDGLLRFWALTNPSLTRKLRSVVVSRSSKFMATRPHVVAIEPLPGLHDVWTLTTETGNYVAYGFASKNCDPQPHKFAKGGYSYDGSSNDLDLHRLLRATCYVRRHKTEVLDQLPPKQRVTVPLELTATALRDYRRAQDDIVRFLREHHGQRAELASLLQGLSREHARVVAAEVARKAGEAASRAPGLVEMNTLRRLLAEAKLPQVIDWTRTFLAGSDSEKLVLFAVHRDIQTELVKAFPSCAHIISGDTVEHIEADKARFQTDPACRLIVCSLGVAKEGHTLTAASNVAFCEFDWAPLALEQAEDRVYGRLNDLHGATCHYLLGVGPEDWDGFATIDEVMARRIDDKRRSNAATIDGHAADAVLGESILGGVLETLLGGSRTNSRDKPVLAGPYQATTPTDEDTESP